MSSFKISDGFGDYSVLFRALSVFFYFLSYYLFIYLFIFAAHGLFLVALSRGCFSLWCTGFSLWWLLLLQNRGSGAQAQQLWLTGLVTPWHVKSS